MSEKKISPPVNLSELLKPEDILFLDAKNKKDVFSHLIGHLAQKPQVKDPQELEKGIWYRENLLSTGIGLGVAVPHVRLESVDDIVLCAAICPQGIDDYESMDGLPVKIVFMIIAKKDQHASYLKVLSALCAILKDHIQREKLIHAPDVESFYDILTGIHL